MCLKSLLAAEEEEEEEEEEAMAAKLAVAAAVAEEVLGSASTPLMNGICQIKIAPSSPHVTMVC